MKYATIKDIAIRLGISKSTVSRALSGNSNISKETRELVKKAAKEMGYRRNEMAANLRQQKTKTIGIIVPEMTTPFFMYVIISIQNTLNELGYKAIITQSQENS